jgi:hypothetical protein
LRRFTFKIKFEYLKRNQIKQAFEYFFNLEPSKSIELIEGLTPGDFAVVAKKVQFLGLENILKEIELMLRSEVEIKMRGSINKIGFLTR